MKNRVRSTPMEGHGEEGFARAATPWHASDCERPVFVDDSGRRARAVYGIGAAMLGLFAIWLSGLVIGMFGAAGFPAPRIADVARAGIAHRQLADPDALADHAGAIDVLQDRAHVSCPPVRDDPALAALAAVTRRRQGVLRVSGESAQPSYGRGAGQGCGDGERHELRLT